MARASGSMTLDAQDRRLLDLLRADARVSIAELAAKLRVSRASIYARISRLKRDGVLGGFTIVPGPALTGGEVRAHIMVRCDANKRAPIESALVTLEPGQMVFAVSGSFDFIVVASVDSLTDLNALIDRIGALPGVVDTTTSVILTELAPQRAGVRHKA